MTDDDKKKVFKLDSSSAFDRPTARRARDSLLGLADSAAAFPEEEGSALDLVARQAERAPPAAPPSKRGSPLEEMQDRLSLGDYSGALVVAEALLEEDPTHAAARECAEACKKVLEKMYTTRIGALDRVPFVAVSPEQLRWLNLDHRAGFVLSHIDGICSLEQILDVSGMPKLDALRILFELMQQRVVSFR